MNTTDRNLSQVNRKAIFAGLLLTLLLPGLFSVKAARALSPLSQDVNARLDFSTYFGGDGTSVSAIATDRDGKVYVAGFAARDFPTTSGAFQSAPSSGNAAPFVAKFDPTNEVIVCSTFLGGFLSRISDIAVDVQGNAYVVGSTSDQDFPVTPGAIQVSKESGTYAFITKLNASGSALVYSTYFGGSGTGMHIGECGQPGAGCMTEARAIKVDSSGQAYIAGKTNSDLLPVTPDAFQRNRVRSDCGGGGLDPPILPCLDAFVAKLNASGSSLVYSTYLGGNGDDSATGLAIDSSGNAYIAGSGTLDFPVSAPLETSGPAFVSKLNAGGSALVYSTRIDGGIDPTDIALDPSGSAYVTGSTNSVSLATTPGAFRPTSSNTLASKSTDGGSHWSASHTGLTGQIFALAVDPANSSNVYAAGSLGIFGSNDGGKKWASPLSASPIRTIAFDPQKPTNAYAVSAGFFGEPILQETADAGRTWVNVNPVYPVSAGFLSISNVTIDPTDSSVVYGTFATNDYTLVLFKTVDGGRSWSRIGKGLPDRIGSVLGISPSNPSVLLAWSSVGALYRSGNAGKRWKATGLSGKEILSVAFDPLDRAVVYAAGDGIYRSTDVGRSWEKVEDDLPDTTVLSLFIDPAASSTIYANTVSGVFKSTNRGRNWERIDQDLNGCSRILAIDPRDPRVLYAGGCNVIYEIFAARINAAGTAFDYLTYLGPGNQSSIAVDAEGNAYISGSTVSAAFPVRNAFQPNLVLPTDAFIAKLNRTGTDVIFSTYYGGNGSDVSVDIALDSAGRAWIAGSTDSINLPTVNPIQPNLRGRRDGFLASVVSPIPTPARHQASAREPSH
jgi:photosystem II stability/assembly factor-like uncharacterized protein